MSGTLYADNNRKRPLRTGDTFWQWGDLYRIESTDRHNDEVTLSRWKLMPTMARRGWLYRWNGPRRWEQCHRGAPQSAGLYLRWARRPWR